MLCLEILAMPFLALAAVAVVGIVINTVWDYHDYRNGKLGWQLVPRLAKTLWRHRHPNESFVEFRTRRILNTKED